MTAFLIEDQKSFTAGLFLGGLFDAFLVREAEIVTFNRFSLDGRVRQGYYSDEELEEKRIEEYSAWPVVKPVCYSLIKGKRLPESFRIVFMLSPGAKEAFLARCAAGMAPESVGGLYLNVSYENGEMHCVTGLSMNVFTLDKTLEREWDLEAGRFLKENGIAASSVE